MKRVKIQEGSEALKRTLLLMKYDLNKTLTENADVSEPIAEQSLSQMTKGATVGATAGAAFGLPGALIGGLIGATAMAFGNAKYDTAKKLFQACKTEKSTPTLSIDDLDRLADKLNGAIQGIGTDEDAISQAFTEIPTIPDLCGLIKAYEIHGDLFDDLDGDLDSDTEWKDYVLLPLRKAMRKSSEISKSGDDVETFKKFIISDWGKEINGKETYRKKGNLFIVNDGTYDYSYKKEGDTFTYVG